MFLKVAHNRLMELPPVLALLQNLESLDVSNNRLATLDPLDLSLMPRLQILNLQVLVSHILHNIAVIFGYILCAGKITLRSIGVHGFFLSDRSSWIFCLFQVQ